MANRTWKLFTALACVSALGACATKAVESAAEITEIAIPGAGVYPESITSSANGDIFIGSAGTGAILRARPGETAASVWLTPGQTGMVSMLGVFADDARNRLLVCARPVRGTTGPEADARSALKVFALDTGALVASYPFPGGAAGVCNDIGVDAHGGAFVTETVAGKIFRLAPGAGALELWSEDARFAGADGIAVGADGAVVFNTVTTGKLFRIAVGADGKAGAVTELRPSIAPLDRPDGMRAIAGGRFVQAEGGAAGRVTEFSIVGDEARMRVLGGVPGSATVTLARGRVWSVDAKLRYLFDPTLAGQDPGAFSLYSLPLE
ncbi:MAG: hypothetical protein JNJ73_12930 [Hyphomonadaceae bacterium]|nr:hypothetical protein [Hyphomonadaceae bacterium]